MTVDALPDLSVVVVGHRMARQFANTLFTLSRAYQRELGTLHYEVIVVENDSDDALGGESIAALPNNFRYFRRTETSRSPAGALNFGLQQCRGECIGLMLDGARLLSPRTLSYAALAHRMDAHSLTIVPGYHLGEVAHHELTDGAAAYVTEERLLGDIDWRDNGYLLFTVSTPGGGNARGVLQPFMESNCLFAARSHFERIGGIDNRFQHDGGGAINLHLFRALGMLEDSRLVVLPGEGSFHQYHGGVTTRARPDREQELRRYRDELDALWNGQFHALRREPFLLGAITAWAMPAMEQSVRHAIVRHHRLDGLGQSPWQDDTDIATQRTSRQRHAPETTA